MTLALHLQPLISRLEFGLYQDNPLLKSIKSEMGEGYELAVIASKVIDSFYHLKMNEEEIGYIALHFSLALKRKNDNLPHKKIAIICSTGMGTARLLQYQIMEEYHYRVEDIILSDILHISNLDFKNIKCIFTTIPLSNIYPVPVIQVDLSTSGFRNKPIDSFLQETLSEDAKEYILKHLLLYPKLELSSKEETIKFIAEEIKKKYKLSLYDDILKREELSSTEIGKSIAVPHPYNYSGEEPIYLFITLNKPIKWKFNDVKLVIFVASPKSDKYVEVNDFATKSISNIFESEKKLDKLFNDLSYDTLMEIV